MKRFLTILLFLVTIMNSLAAQTVIGSFDALKGQTRVRMIIDYTEADIMGMTEDEFYGYQEDWAEDKQWVINHYYECANKKLGERMMVSNYKNSKYTLHLVVHAIDMKGNHDCSLYLYEISEDGKQTKLAEVPRIYGKGGKTGGEVGLIKDGAESVGKIIGILLRKEVLGTK